ncbi:MAG TPA: SDR family oxidoreductase [Mycobacteriales bacterium]|jgi:NAD(P)-dependent dehydrogenase (short-subunit alcohol dehydrogenase family)|nr:SDR family oxidoreductase [Mycobacteriales bacterium]
MDLGVRDKGYVIVGGTSGMGLATARVLAGEQASVVVVGRDPERAQRVVASLADAGGRVCAVTGDIRVSDEVARLVTEAVDRLGRLDGVGVFTGITGHATIDISDEEWTDAFRDVLLGTSRVVEHCLPHLTKQGGTVVTTSAYSIRAPEIIRLPYTSLKAGVAAFTKGIAKAYGGQGVRANCICPGAIETEPMQELRQQLARERGFPVEEAIERVMESEWGLELALGRLGRPEEVGELAAFLLSPRAGYLTGALINIDGGTNF